MKTSLGYGDESFYLFDLNIDKDFYYYYEYINVSATWENYYPENGDQIYVQLKLFDIYENIMWNSPEYNEQGLISRNWTINIQSLNLSLINNPNVLFLKLYKGKIEFPGSSHYDELRETLTISVAKNDIVCNLQGFNDTLSYGEQLEFEASFSYLSDQSGLPNQTIKFLILFNNNVILQQNLTSDNDGMVIINISTTNILRIGENDLRFEIIDLGFINNSIFQYTLVIMKSKILTEILEFKDKINVDDYIDIKLKFYYINCTIQPLADENIILNVYKNSHLKAQSTLKTNSTGYLWIVLNPSNFGISNEDESISLLLKYNGSNVLENATLSFQIIIRGNLLYRLEQLNLITIISTCAGTILTIMLIVYFKHTKEREKKVKLKDIAFKF